VEVAEHDTVQEGKCCYVYVVVVEAGQTYTDLTGWFPATYLIVNGYILFLNDFNSNTINTKPMKNTGEKEMVCAYNLLIQDLISTSA
jgi:hypothetical protein